MIPSIKLCPAGKNLFKVSKITLAFALALFCWPWEGFCRLDEDCTELIKAYSKSLLWLFSDFEQVFIGWVSSTRWTKLAQSQRSDVSYYSIIFCWFWTCFSNWVSWSVPSGILLSRSYSQNYSLVKSGDNINISMVFVLIFQPTKMCSKSILRMTVA